MTLSRGSVYKVAIDGPDVGSKLWLVLSGGMFGLGKFNHFSCGKCGRLNHNVKAFSANLSQVAGFKMPAYSAVAAGCQFCGESNVFFRDRERRTILTVE